MDKRKWSNPRIPVEALMTKLMEETGEVAREISDAQFGTRKLSAKRLNAELDHVIFMAEQMKRRVALGQKVTPIRKAA